ncbi:MAG: cyclase family protein [Chloroflexi bacterium]|nr:cyclase family protein [Chloroflexota bacterium]
MRIIDITLNIRNGMVVWPGDDPVEIVRVSKIEEGANANVSSIRMGAHTGTHVDAPYHFVPDGSGVEQMPLEVLVGPVQVVEIPESVRTLDAEELSKVHFLENIERVLFKTNNSNYWGEEGSNFQKQFVGITLDGAEFLVQKKIRLIGIDYLSIAPYHRSKPTHEMLLHTKTVIVEGLDLRNVTAGHYTLYCLPLKLEGADGAPARVILIQE